MKPLHLCISALCLAAAAPAVAQDNPDDNVITKEEVEGDRILLGAGVGITPSYEGSDDYRFTPVLIAQGRLAGVAFQLRGTKLYTDVISDEGPWDFQLGPAGALNLNRNSGIKDARVEALGKLDPAIEVGAVVGIGKSGLITSEYDKLNFTVAYMRDVAGVHDSEIIIPTLDYGTPLSTRSFVGIAVSAEYVGEGYADAYFSVSPAGAAASGLPVYNAEAGWKSWTLTGLGLISLTGDLTGGLGLVASGSYRRMINDFGASPVVSVAGSRDQWVGMLGLAYTF